MPIYEYQCARCGTFEVTQRITEKPLRRCPACKGKITKLISNTSFQLKGSGWYVTDYASKGAGKKAKTESAGEVKTAATSESAPKEAKDSSGKKSEATAA